jgi:hypothetical protein
MQELALNIVEFVRHPDLLTTNFIRRCNWCASSLFTGFR